MLGEHRIYLRGYSAACVACAPLCIRLKQAPGSVCAGAVNTLHPVPCTRPPLAAFSAWGRTMLAISLARNRLRGSVPAAWGLALRGLVVLDLAGNTDL